MDTGAGYVVGSTTTTRSTGCISRAVDAGPVMAVPLSVRRVRKARSWRAGGRSAEFTPADLDMATTFANHAAVALELADAAPPSSVALLEDRDRIARDLHDHVIQRLFAAGMSVESAATVLGPDRGLTGSAVWSDIDDTIRQIRTSIFQLAASTRSAPERGPAAGRC